MATSEICGEGGVAVEVDIVTLRLIDARDAHLPSRGVLAERFRPDRVAVAGLFVAALGLAIEGTAAGSANTTALSGAFRGWPRPRKGRSRGSSIAEPLVIACAPPTITIVETAEAAAEMAAMETMTSAPVTTPPMPPHRGRDRPCRHRRGRHRCHHAPGSADCSLHSHSTVGSCRDYPPEQAM